MTTLCRIQIQNFRSIKSIDIDINDMTIFVGQNDAGKSNILRALNLFFNGSTDPDTLFDFDSDHYVLNNPNKKAKEISITLEFELPPNYVRRNGDRIVWTKRWRDYGEEKIVPPYFGVRITKNNRDREIREKVEITPKSNIHALLRQINLIYVPAIRDKFYFENLQGNIYELIADIAEDKFKTSSHDFESAISEHLGKLTSDLSEMLKFPTNLALPNDLTHIFEKLDFQGGDHSISLRNRGDGIKARHIPIILKFLATEKKDTQTRGSPPHTYIWAYEEPENNIEATRCFEMADDFWSYINQGVAQILITTHSPVFYNLTNKNTEEEKRTTVHHIYLENTESGTKATNDETILDDTMGITRLLAPYIKIEQEEWEKRKAAAETVKLAVQQEAFPIFVEGETDKYILLQAFELHASHIADKIDILTVRRGGTEYVKNRLISWYHLMKSTPVANRKKAFGLFDDDEAGIEAKKQLELATKAKPKNVLRHHLLSAPSYLKPLRDDVGMQFPIVLESYYPECVWENAVNEGWVKNFHCRKFITDQQFDEMTSQGISSLSDYLGEEYHHSLEYTFVTGNKLAAAEYAMEHAKDNVLNEFKGLVYDISEYFFPEENHPWKGQ